MESQFLFISTNIDNENLLKEEIKNFYPNLKMSYGKKGFVTFKSETPISLYQLIDYKLAFARRIFLNLKKCKAADLNQNIEQFQFNKIHYFQITEASYPLFQFQNKINEQALEGEVILNIAQVAPDEFWLGLHIQNEYVSPFPNAQPHITINEQAPSRAYYKIAEAIAEFPILNKKIHFLEIGSAPGGASLFLCEHFQHVIGIDPAVMDEKFHNITNFSFIHKPIQDVGPHDLKPYKNILAVAVDMNLKPKLGLYETLRVVTDIKDKIEGLYFTCKIGDLSLVKDIPHFLSILRTAGFKKIIMRQLPHHKQEFLIYCSNL